MNLGELSEPKTLASSTASLIATLGGVSPSGMISNMAILRIFLSTHRHLIYGPAWSERSDYLIYFFAIFKDSRDQLFGETRHVGRHRVLPDAPLQYA